MDDMNEQTYRLFSVVSDEDGMCEFVVLTSAGPLDVVATIKQVLDEINAGRTDARVYVMEPAYQEWQE